jgi:hypothetical protein
MLSAVSLLHGERERDGFETRSSERTNWMHAWYVRWRDSQPAHAIDQVSQLLLPSERRLIVN